MVSLKWANCDLTATSDCDRWPTLQLSWPMGQGVMLASMKPARLVLPHWFLIAVASVAALLVAPLFLLHPHCNPASHGTCRTGRWGNLGEGNGEAARLLQPPWWQPLPIQSNASSHPLFDRIATDLRPFARGGGISSVLVEQAYCQGSRASFRFQVWPYQVDSSEVQLAT